ncbi:MAG: arabinose isomerase, partial [Planctomycetes bacterium]|nr:arabinose isomerase [Planctomycetota bacterium]
LECSKAMARGLGYAGEGDALTASLVAVLNGAFERTTFTEIFCPDWEGNSLFLSHMGEINPAVAADRPRLCEKEFPWTGALNPAVIACAPAPGPAVLANLAPGPDDTFRLIVAPVEVLGDTKSPAMRDTVRGWIRPAGGVERFLEAFSRAGGTHHSALVIGAQAEEVAALATFAGIERVALAP